MSVTAIPVYKPKSRRPIADAFRQTARGAVSFCVRFNIHPDAVSYCSVIAAAGAAVCFWQSQRFPIALLILAPMLCHLRLWLNMLDGMVALASGKASPRGEILNDLPDRISDVLIFVGVAHSGWCNPFSGYWAAILALLTAYVGTLGQAVGVQREFSGVMSKPLRMVALNVGGWVFLLFILAGRPIPRPLRFTIIDWTCFVVIAGCIQTICVRLVRIMRALRERAP